jgi:SAM-dependent methyltransferase
MTSEQHQRGSAERVDLDMRDVDDRADGGSGLTRGDGSVTDANEIFDEPSAWRLDAVLRLDLRGEELMAGASTGVGYPLALEPIVSDLQVGPGRRALDLGAGLGGVAHWIASSTGADVTAVEPEQAAVAGARRLFPGLAFVQADATMLPFAGGQFDAVTLLGVVSLVAELRPLIDEVARVLRPGGRVGLSDLCLVAGSVARSVESPNTFRSLANLVDELERSRFTVVELALGAADVPTRWDDVGRRVDAEMSRRHGGSSDFDAWVEDRRSLRDAISDGDLHLASLVATRPE